MKEARREGGSYDGGRLVPRSLAKLAQPHDATSLSAADDRIRQSAWLPPQEGVIPRIRLG